jgi:hypothetical protein
MVQVKSGINSRPYLKNNESKNGWWHGLSGSVPALSEHSPEFKLQKPPRK